MNSVTERLVGHSELQVNARLILAAQSWLGVCYIEYDLWYLRWWGV